MDVIERTAHEIEHGRQLAAGDTETLWGWGTSAGKARAQRRGNIITEGAKLDSSKLVLEIGCGTGLFTEMFTATGAHVVAVDISADLIRKAQARNLPSERVHWVLGRFEDCSFQRSFDAIIGSSVLHHLDLEEALPHMYRLLKPGGLISFAEPNLLNPQVFLMFRARFLFPELSPDEDALVRWSFINQLVAHGFTEIDIHAFDWLHPSTPQLLIPHVSSLGRWLESIPGIREFAGSLAIRARRPETDVESGNGRG